MREVIRTVWRQKADTVFVLIVFCVFAVSVLMVLALSAGIYKNINETSQEGYDERTALSYVWTRVKSGDSEGSISVGEFHGYSALIIDEQLSGTLYRTLIYAHAGRLNVLFSEAGLNLTPDSGVPVVDVESMTFQQLEYGIISVSTATRTLLLSPRGNS